MEDLIGTQWLLQDVKVCPDVPRIERRIELPFKDKETSVLICGSSSCNHF